MGEKFELELEEEFFEFIKDDLIKIQNPTPKELLVLFLNQNKKIFELNKNIKKIIEKIESLEENRR
jgi:hypothetical protein